MRSQMVQHESNDGVSLAESKRKGGWQSSNEPSPLRCLFASWRYRRKNQRIPHIRLRLEW